MDARGRIVPQASDATIGVERREVEIGENNQLYVQVVEGLEEGEHVALDARTRVAAELKTAPQAAPDSSKEQEKRPAR